MVVVVALGLPVTSRGGSPPDQEWHTLETAHFHIHHYQGGEAMARRVAGIAEEAWALLTPVLGWEPDERVQVVLRDEGDGANGFATPSSYSQITLLAFPPEADSELGNYDDYMRILVYHELTHILHLDNVSGAPAIGNLLFGKTFLPNFATPDWLIEGIATWIESAYTPAGRVHDAYFDMYIRASLLAGDPITISEMSGAPMQLPRATAWYAYGGTFVTWLIERTSEEALRRFIHLYGRRVVPYALNLTASHTFGDTLTNLYDQWLEHERERAMALKERLEQQGLMGGAPFTTGGEFHGNASFRPGTRQLAYVISDGRDRSRMVLRDLDTGEEERLVTCYGGCSRPTWSPDGSALYYVRSEPYRTFHRYKDLVRLDIEPRTITRLTEGRRAREPAISPDGRTLAFVASRWGETDLWLRDVSTGEERLVVRGDLMRQPAQPAWSPDGRTLAISMQAAGVRDLYLVEAATGALERLTWSAARDVQPQWSPDGRHLLYSSSEGGVWNVWALRVTDRRRFQVTRVLTGATQPEVDSAGRDLVYRSYSVTGWDLARMPYDPDAWEEVAPVEEPLALATRDYVPLAPEVLEEGPYDASWTLWPRSWFPDISFLQGDSLNIGLSVGGADVVGHHAWVVSSQWTAFDPRPSVAATYTNNRFLPSLSLTGAWVRRDRLAFDGAGTVEYEDELLLGSLGIGLPFPGLDESLSLAFRFDVQHARPLNRPEARPEPDGLRPRLPVGGTSVAITSSWAYDNTESYYYSVAPESGRRLGLTFYLQPRLTAHDGTSYAFRWSWTEYLPALWVDHHVWALRVSGGISGGDSPEVFRLGGIPDRSLVDDILNQRGIGGAQLRGYAPGSIGGTEFHLGNLEYLFPIWYVHDGIGTLPFQLGRLYGVVFTDAGTATRTSLTDARWRVGVGGELRATFDIAYGGALTVRVGAAQGLLEEGDFQFYVVSGGGF